MMTPHSQRSSGLGEGMNQTDPDFAIWSAVMNVCDRNAILRRLQEIGERNGTHIICFDMEKMVGVRHAEEAIRHAYRSFFCGNPISNSFEMEALLYAAGTRQCAIAASFGIHDGENHLYVCCCPSRDAVLVDLSKHMRFVSVPEEGGPIEKISVLAALFDITPEELDAAGVERVVDLVIERIALLEISK